MDSAEHEQPDPDAPVKQSHLPTEAVPVAREAGGDPMASIRPEVPESAPLVTATVALSEPAAGPGDSSGNEELETTFKPPPGSHAGPGEQSQITHDSGPCLIPVSEGPNAGEQSQLDSPYVLLEQIGTGGMGEVWEARQRSLGRPVALKRLRERRGIPRMIQQQFESEARLTGALDHPNIVTVYELGRDQAGRVFYTMKLIEGTAWRDVISTGQRRTGDGSIVQVELRDHLDILIEASQAVAFAHSRGIIHRDIKPANVMIGDYGEVLLVDWGLAVALRPLPSLGGVQTGTLASLPRAALVCGTPAYMSPETANAQRDRIGPATDVYLLGAVLYHVLYGRPPHQGKTVKQVITKAKVNAWTYPSKINGRLKPWDALLRPVLNRALASDPKLRFADAGEFVDALRLALRNYDSAKIASLAQEQLDAWVERGADENDPYRALAALIARLEGALESWPRNLAARQTLGQAQLEFANLALRNGDLGLAKLSIDAYEQLPPLPEDEPERVNRRLTLHPVDGTLISAPRPTDSLIAAGTSNQFSSAAELATGSPSGKRELARTLGASRAGEIHVEDSGDTRARLGRSNEDVGLASVASVQIQQVSTAEIRDDALELAATAGRLRRQLSEREQLVKKRRRKLWWAGALAGVLAVSVLVVLVGGRMVLARERDRARAERDTISKVLLNETANSVEGQLELHYGPIHGALMTAAWWASDGSFDLDDPRLLNRYFMPLLNGLETASSVLWADAEGNEYMLLREPSGWRTRSTVAGGEHEQRSWTARGELLDQAPNQGPPYDPHTRPWYQGGDGLREQARQAVSAAKPRPIFWTEPYRFFTTQELGISVSTPVTSASGREFVIAFDVKLDDISRITRSLPEGIERGQVFVLDEQLRVLGLPREAVPASGDPNELLLEPITELEAAPLSRAAVLEWSELGRVSDPFVLDYVPGQLGVSDLERYWVSLRLVEREDRPKLWIGVVVPESHFLER
ncbi:serine/threonine protein kinase [Enhygromyxa salina]|uniref:Serine/threonine protein kinase n=1 Tax=Enhygromyxa salina TaxID=215803 RepID=A0A0C1ZRR7_9BACT|nr:protein kinase [Enhygromyxa salina]KIG13723.1 serine/threonine protein kinase [Enhygromyxa salina]